MLHLKNQSAKNNNVFKLYPMDKEMAEIEKEMKMAIIAGASHALQYKKDNPRAADEEAIQHVTREANNIISKINTEE